MKILKFSAPWCNPCKQLSQALDGVDLGCLLEEINIDDDQELPAKFAVRGVPTLVMVDDEGHELGRLTGMTSRDRVKSWVSELQ